MPTTKSVRLPPPKSWEEFEVLCADLFARIWNDPGTQRNGRTGQPQHGVDIFGRPNGGVVYAGVQARTRVHPTGALTLGELYLGELYEEVEKAKHFVPALASFTIATTAPNDNRVQEEARVLTVDNAAAGLFSVDVLGWGEIESRLADYPDLLHEHYPQFGGELTDVASRKAVQLLEQQAKWAEERERPKFELAQQGGGRLAASFTPEFKLSHIGGDQVPHLEWRFRGPLFSMEWRCVSIGALDGMKVTNTFDLNRAPENDDLVTVDQIGIEIRFHWHGRMRVELHRWPLDRTLHPTKHMYDIGAEIIPPICADSD